MFTLRIDSGIGYGGGYRATLYGPGLPSIEPALDMNVVNLGLHRAMRQIRELGPMPRPDHVFGVTDELLVELEAHQKKRGPR